MHAYLHVRYACVYVDLYRQRWRHTHSSDETSWHHATIHVTVLTFMSLYVCIVFWHFTLGLSVFNYITLHYIILCYTVLYYMIWYYILSIKGPSNFFFFWLSPSAHQKNPTFHPNFIQTAEYAIIRALYSIQTAQRLIKQALYFYVWEHTYQLLSISMGAYLLCLWVHIYNVYPNLFLRMHSGLLGGKLDCIYCVLVTMCICINIGSCI